MATSKADGDAKEGDHKPVCNSCISGQRINCIQSSSPILKH